MLKDEEMTTAAIKFFAGRGEMQVAEKIAEFVKQRTLTHAPSIRSHL
jgi:hypothetical protein